REDLKIICNYRIRNIKNYKDTILKYADIWCGTPLIANDFINRIADGSFYNFFEVKYIGRKRVKGQEGNRFPNNLIFDFNFDTFLALTGNYEDMHKYETAYRHYFMLIYLLELMKRAGVNTSSFDEDFYNKFFSVLYDNINSTVLTGMEAFAEFDLGYPYVLLFDELRYLTPESKRKFTYQATPDNMSVTLIIKEYSIVASKFAKYLANAPTEKDIDKVVTKCGRKYRLRHSDVIHTFEGSKLDTTTHSELRIVEGSAPNRMKVIVKLSGQRIINRLFSINGNVERNVKTHKLHEYIYMADNFVAFTLWVFLNSTKESKDNFKDVKASSLLPYILYINEEAQHRQRGIISVTATVILLSKMNSKDREVYLKENFKDTDTHPKTLLRKAIAKISRMQARIKNKQPLVTRLVKELKHGYKW
ncbi:MAG: hypothetical protein NC200_07295, partial [Candidatus Gastranaerophilales bacterium]|nr:hypothetical protein [Candidatus Gastranaerophilales bacterium]